MTGLKGSTGPLFAEFDLALLDLDGVVYVGSGSVPHAVDALNAATAAGLPLVYVTNNASRSADVVAEHLTELGLCATPADVVTSAQAAASYLADEFPSGAGVLVVGGDGLREAIVSSGLSATPTPDEAPVAVVMGFGPDVSWRDLAGATRAVRDGARFVATNRDRTFPLPDGPAPGNGAFVQAVADASGCAPVTMGKPEPGMFQQSARARGARRPLVVGDRLDTDIEGGVRAGYSTLLVMTGVTDPRDLLRAPIQHRPSYIAADLRGLSHHHRAPALQADGWACGAFVAARTADCVEVRSAGSGQRGSDGAASDGLDALRAACAAAWTAPGQRAFTEPGTGEWRPIDDVVGLDWLTNR